MKETFWEKRQQSLDNITSERGIHLRMNRSIQVEGAFGLIKNDFGFRRFLTTGKKNVRIELLFLALGLWLYILLEDLKRCAVCILRSKRASWKIPGDIIKEIARCLLLDIISYCESEEGKAEFERWKAQQAEAQKSKAG